MQTLNPTPVQGDTDVHSGLKPTVSRPCVAIQDPSQAPKQLTIKYKDQTGTATTEASGR